MEEKVEGDNSIGVWRNSKNETGGIKWELRAGKEWNE